MSRETNTSVGVIYWVTLVVSFLLIKVGIIIVLPSQLLWGLNEEINTDGTNIHCTKNILFAFITYNIKKGNKNICLRNYEYIIRLYING